MLFPFFLFSLVCIPGVICADNDGLQLARKLHKGYQRTGSLARVILSEIELYKVLMEKSTLAMAKISLFVLANTHTFDGPKEHLDAANKHFCDYIDNNQEYIWMTLEHVDKLGLHKDSLKDVLDINIPGNFSRFSAWLALKGHFHGTKQQLLNNFGQVALEHLSETALIDMVSDYLKPTNKLWTCYIHRIVNGDKIDPIVEKGAMNVVKSFDRKYDGFSKLLAVLKDTSLSKEIRYEKTVSWICTLPHESQSSLLYELAETPIFFPLFKAALCQKLFEVAKLLLAGDFGLPYAVELEGLKEEELMAVFAECKHPVSGKKRMVLDCWYVKAKPSCDFTKFIHHLLYKTGGPETSGKLLKPSENVAFSMNALTGFEDGAILEKILVMSAHTPLHSEAVLRCVCKVWRNLLSPERILRFPPLYSAQFFLSFQKSRSTIDNLKGKAVAKICTDSVFPAFSNPDFNGVTLKCTAIEQLSVILVDNILASPVKNVSTITTILINLCKSFPKGEECLPGHFMDRLIDGLSSDEIVLLFHALDVAEIINEIDFSDYAIVQILDAFAQTGLEIPEAAMETVREAYNMERIRFLVLLRSLYGVAPHLALQKVLFGHDITFDDLIQFLTVPRGDDDYLFTFALYHDADFELIDAMIVDMFVKKQAKVVPEDLFQWVLLSRLFKTAFKRISDTETLAQVLNEMKAYYEDADEWLFMTTGVYCLLKHELETNTNLTQ